jgi:hypothetical protein
LFGRYQLIRPCLFASATVAASPGFSLARPIVVYGIPGQNVDPEQLGRELGLIKPFEKIVGSQ